MNSGLRKNRSFYLIAVVLIVIIVGLALAAFRPVEVAETLPNFPDVYPLEVSVEEAAALREEGAFMLDVRQPEEWEAGHIPGATLIPLGELPNRLDEVPRDQQIVVVCRSGNRSASGRDILRDAGFTTVTSMAGGMTQWSAAGYEVVVGK